MTTNQQKVCIIGLGGGGCRTVELIGASLRHPALSLLQADADAAALAKCGAGTRLLLGSGLTGPDGCYGDDAIGASAAGAALPQFQDAIGDAGLLLVVAGLGGGTGAGAAGVVARLAREKQANTMFFVTLPFSFEGNRCRKQAEAQLAALRQLCDAVVAVPNDLLFSSLPANTPAAEAMRLAAAMLADSIGALARLGFSEGILPVNLGAMRQAVGAAPESCRLGTGRGRGPERGRLAVEAFLECPFVGGADYLAKADTAVIAMVGPANLALGEVQTCLGAMERLFPENARVMVGAYTDASLQDELQIAGLAFRHKSKTPAPAPAKATAAPAKAPQQGELPLLEQSLGIFAGSQPTIFDGENLDIPVFQRRGIHLDAGF